MPRPLQFLLFLSILLLVLGGTHFYVWARLVRDTAMPDPWRGGARAALVVLGAGIPVSFFAGRLVPPAVARAAHWVLFTWMGLLFLLVVWLAAGDLVKIAVRVVWLVRDGRIAAADPARRLALARLVGGGAAAVAAALGAWGVRTALGRVIVREVRVALRRLPRALDGTTVVQLTDLHVGTTLGRPFVQDVVRTANAIAPDLIVITGDLVDGPVERIREAIAPLADLRARWGVFFVTGNHEYFTRMDPIASAESWIAELGKLGIRTLRNERVAIGDPAAPEDGFDLAGIDDHSARGYGGGHGPDLRGALDGRDPGREVVLLAHQPRAVVQAARLGVGLQLSGHTHGGQIWPWNHAVRLQQPYVVGLVRHEGTTLYVSPGTGFWGPPMRVGTRPEVTKIVLSREPDVVH